MHTFRVPLARQPIAIEFRDPSRPAPYVLPAGIATVRTFDSHEVATHAHLNMLSRFSGEQQEAADHTN